MKVINIHHREISQPKSEVAKLFRTLATDNDMMLATDKWSPMKLDKGLQVGSKGGHGAMKYFVTDYEQDNSITFQFDLPGFNGYHKFYLTELEPNKTQLSHIVDVTTTGLATVKLAIAIRWLHDAYIEDAFDKVENHFSVDKKTRKWTPWVLFLRRIFKPKKQNDHSSLSTS